MDEKPWSTRLAKLGKLTQKEKAELAGWLMENVGYSQENCTAFLFGMKPATRVPFLAYMAKVGRILDDV